MESVNFSSFLPAIVRYAFYKIGYKMSRVIQAVVRAGIAPRGYSLAIANWKRIAVRYTYLMSFDSVEVSPSGCKKCAGTADKVGRGRRGGKLAELSVLLKMVGIGPKIIPGIVPPETS